MGDADNSKSVTAEGDVTVTDYVRYTGLTAGQTYTLTGTLMDKSTKKAFVDADGNPSPRLRSSRQMPKAVPRP